MNIELKEFQSDAVAKLVDHFASARSEAAKGSPQAVSLASPTGSGKTVIATALIEQVLEGDDDHSPDPEATFLWITDQPELNEQTKNKMLATSSALTPGRLVVIDSSLNQETFTPGRVYFLNTQKLGRKSTLVRDGDDRDFTLWQTIANTVAERPTNFYVIIDEAHRGMQGKELAEANSIMQKFIKGSADQIPPIPVLFAISATIERFDEVVAQTTRVKRPVVIPVEDVRESGLLKDSVQLFHPDEIQPGDVTMLREAARSLKRYRERWEKYGKAEGESNVRPVLLVQVKDGSGNKLSATDMSEALGALLDELDNPPAEAFAHAFQEGAPLMVDAITLRYLAPSTIDADPDVQVVFFKTSLNTGWDCPRAEVMMSFRSAKDDTYIAQLVGRMVRAPLARHVTTDEHLNTVGLYLPHYDRKGLKKVIKQLKAGDPATMPPTDIQEGREVVSYSRAGGSDKAFDLLSSLPSYVIPRKKFSSQVRRLGKLSTLLSRYGIDEDAPDDETKVLVDLLLAERSARQNRADFKEVVKESGVLKVRLVEWRYDPEAMPEEEVELPVSEENVNDLFEWAGRRFGEGLNRAYWKARAAAGAKNHQKTKLEAYALAAAQDAVDNLQKKARERVQALLKKHDVAIAKLPDGGREAFNEVHSLATDPELAAPNYPETIEVPKADQSFDKHLYVEPNGKFSFKTTSWEEATIAEEVKRKDVVGWLRNPDRKPWSLCVPYKMGGARKGCYPDFIVIRKVGKGLVADIVDPHLLSYEDAWHRAQGLAEYAAKHANKFGRIEMIRVKDGKVDRLDLMDETQRDRVLKVSSNDHLRELFDTN